jgi:hypothetical protein
MQKLGDKQNMTHNSEFLGLDNNNEDVEIVTKISVDDFELGTLAIIESENLTPVEKAAQVLVLFGNIDDIDERDHTALQKKVRQEVLPEIIGATSYRAFGREISKALRRGPVDVSVLSDTAVAPELAELPEIVRDEVVRRFADGKLVKLKQGKDDTTLLSIGSSKQAVRSLEMGDLDTARYVRRIFAQEPTTVASIDDIKKLYEDHNAERRIQQVRIRTNKPAAHLLPINEMRVGHQDGLPGIELVEAVAQKLQQAPEADRPSAILVTNLVQGDFAHSQSKKRASLVTGLETMTNQFRSAKILLDELKATDIPVILSLGADDHRMAHDYTLDVVAELRKFATGHDNHISYYNQNELLQSETFQQHKRFQIQYMLPLCYTLGRRLRTADEMAEATSGEISRSEYLMLYDHIVMGAPLHPKIDVEEEALKGLGEWYKGMVVVDDADIVFETQSEERLFRYRHTEAFSPETLAANHSDVIMKMLGNLGANGYDLPDASLTGRAQEAVYVTASGVPVVALPGLTDPVQSLHSSQYYRMITGDPSLRANANRRRLWTPTIDEFSIEDNGDVVHRYINKHFLDKADSLPRTAIFELCDIQKGSPTARSDYFIQYLSYILETAERMPVALQWAGDIIHGHIYSNFSDESQAVGLIRITSQKLVIEEYLMKAFGHHSVPRELLDAVIDVLVQQGNHDEVQRKSVPGNNDSNIDYLIGTSKKIFDRDGEPSKVRHNAIFHTPGGTPVPTWMGTTHLGAYTLKTAHYHIERGMKGNSGGLPLYHPYQRIQGLGKEEQADIYLGAHWHNEQAGVIGNKLVVIGGSWADRSEFEDRRGYDAKLAGAVVYLGGGEPPEVRFIHAKNLDGRPIKYGFFTPENLEAHGYRDDPGFDPTKHAQYSNDAWPKSAVQKALNDIERRASQLVEYEAVMDNPNTYDLDGRPVNLNDATRRAFMFGKTIVNKAVAAEEK